MSHFTFNAFDAPRMYYEKANAQYNTSVITISEHTAAETQRTPLQKMNLLATATERANRYGTHVAKLSMIPALQALKENVDDLQRKVNTATATYKQVEVSRDNLNNKRLQGELTDTVHQLAVKMIQQRLDKLSLERDALKAKLDRQKAAYTAVDQAIVQIEEQEHHCRILYDRLKQAIIMQVIQDMHQVNSSQEV